jgi:hypothetical protein
MATLFPAMVFIFKIPECIENLYIILQVCPQLVLCNQLGQILSLARYGDKW